MRRLRINWLAVAAVCLLFMVGGAVSAQASEADINLPDLSAIRFGSFHGLHLMYGGLIVCAIGLMFGLI